VLGYVLGGVLLDRDLGHVVDLVVDVVADVLDHGGSVDGCVNGGGSVDKGGGGVDSSYCMDRGGMGDSDGSSWGLSSDHSGGSCESSVGSAVDTSEETGVAKDLGLGISGSLSVVSVAVVGIRVSISISSVAQSVVTKSISIMSIVSISFWFSISRSLAVVAVAVVGIRVSISISSVTQSMVTQSISISSIVSISICLSLWGAETAGNSQGEDNQEFHVEC